MALLAYEQYQIIVNIYIVGALCAFGIAGNVLSLVVLGRDRTIRRTTGFLMQMLAVTDAAYLVSCLFVSTLNTTVHLTDWLPVAVQRGLPYITVYLHPIAFITLTASVWMVVLLTADRYIAICRPLHAAQYSTLPRLRGAITVLWVLAVTYNLPAFFEIKVAEVEVDHVSPSNGLALNRSDIISDNSTIVDTLLNLTWKSTPPESRQVLMWQLTAMGKNQVYQVIYRLCLDFVVQCLLPLVALVFFNQRLVRALRESDQLRRHSATDGGTGQQHTWMLFVVVIVFIVCQLPIIAWQVCYMLYVYACVPFSWSALRYAVIVVDLMLVVNSSVNVVIYCFMGRQFRAILLRVIGCSGERQNTRRNPEVDPGRPMVPLHRVMTPHPPQHYQSGRESLTSHQSMGDVAVCQVHVVDDVHEMPIEAELDTGGFGCASTPQDESIDYSEDTQA